MLSRFECASRRIDAAAKRMVFGSDLSDKLCFSFRPERIRNRCSECRDGSRPHGNTGGGGPRPGKRPKKAFEELKGRVAHSAMGFLHFGGKTLAGSGNSVITHFGGGEAAAWGDCSASALRSLPEARFPGGGVGTSVGCGGWSWRGSSECRCAGGVGRGILVLSPLLVLPFSSREL